MKSVLVLFLSLLLAPQRALAAVGIEASPFLKIDVGARASAMGGAFTAIADDASGIFYNPAGPALMSKAEIFLSHNQWIEGLNAEQVSYVHPVSDKLTYFAGLSALLSPMMPSYNSEGNATGSFNSLDAMYGAGVALIENGVIAGCFAKMITQEAHNEKGAAYAGDIGVISNYGNFRFGAAAQNLGGKMKIYREEFNLPQIYRGGLAYRALDKYWFSGEVRKLGEADISYAVGAEGEFNITTSASAFIRLGFNSGRSQNTGSGMSAGLGLSFPILSFDYAFSPFGDLGETHRLTMSLRFGKNREVLPRTIYTKPAAKSDAPAPAPDQEPVQVEPIPLPNAALEAANNYYAQKDYPNAASQYAVALKTLPEGDKLRIQVFERQGQISLKGKSIAKAKEFFLAAIQTAKKLAVTNVSVVNAYLGLAYCFEKSENAAAALKNYEKALTLSDNEKTKTRIRKSIQRLKTNSVETGADDILIK